VQSDRDLHSSAMKIQEASLSETFINVYQTTRRHIQDDCNFHDQVPISKSEYELQFTRLFPRTNAKKRDLKMLTLKQNYWERVAVTYQRASNSGERKHT
jgi:hypothetical protein